MSAAVCDFGLWNGLITIRFSGGLAHTGLRYFAEAYIGSKDQSDRRRKTPVDPLHLPSYRCWTWSAGRYEPAPSAMGTLPISGHLCIGMAD